MGKHGKNNLSSQDIQTQRKKKKEEFKKNLSNFQQTKSSSQKIDLPRLHGHKANILNEMQNKKIHTSKEMLIESLKNRLENENTNTTINMGHLLEGAHNSKLISKEYQYNSLLKVNDYLNKDEDEFLNEDIKGNNINKDFSKKSFMKDLKQVIEASDVVLQVLDARDPLAYRSIELENQIKSHKDEKKLILVINKIDLVPPENAQAWKKILEREYPCVLFKANTQTQNSNLSNITIYHSSLESNKDFIDKMIHSNKAVGGEDLMNILKNYCGGGLTKSKKTIVVGIVGFPNVGKSSIINSLTRGKSVGVSSTPGFTKSIGEIILDKQIKLLDCPGVVYSSNSEKNILSNIIRPENIEDPVNVVKVILNKVPYEELIRVYDIDVNETNIISNIFDSKEIDLNQAEKFCCYVGTKIGKMKKGGIPDLEQTAISIIQDWNKGKLKYMTKIPNEYFTNEMEID